MDTPELNALQQELQGLQSEDILEFVVITRDGRKLRATPADFEALSVASYRQYLSEQSNTFTTASPAEGGDDKAPSSPTEVFSNATTEANEGDGSASLSPTEADAAAAPRAEEPPPAGGNGAEPAVTPAALGKAVAEAVTTKPKANRKGGAK